MSYFFQGAGDPEPRMFWHRKVIRNGVITICTDQEMRRV